MSDESCDCGTAAVEQATDATAGPDRWVDERPVETARLPDDVARVMSEFYPTESVETFEEFVAASRATAGGGSLSVADLCHVDGETPHVARADGETYRFRCFFDGVALAYLVDEAVEIRTESPGGSAVELRVTPDGTVDTTPADAAMSFGIATGAADVTDPAVDDVYEGVCAYVKAFPSREAYQAWAAAVDGATVGLPLADALPIAAALAE